MSDAGTRMADRSLKTVDRKIRSTYRQAEKEMEEKLADFVKAHQEKNRDMLKQLEAGIIDKDEYARWLSGQVFQQKQWEDKIKQIQEILEAHKEEAMDVVREGQIDTFAENYNFMARKSGRTVNMTFSTVDGHTAARLIKRNPQLLPKWKIDEEKEYKWSYKKAQNAIKQGIIQGESIDKIAKRMAENLCSQDMNRMRMFSRTAVTEAENAGRMEMLRDAEKMGIRVMKKWLATNDDRTRDSHAELDGETVELDEEFSNGLMYPGDPNGDPSEVYNCRCTLIYVYPDYE